MSHYLYGLFKNVQRLKIIIFGWFSKHLQTHPEKKQKEILPHIEDNNEEPDNVDNDDVVSDNDNVVSDNDEYDNDEDNADVEHTTNNSINSLIGGINDEIDNDIDDPVEVLVKCELNPTATASAEENSDRVTSSKISEKNKKYAKKKNVTQKSAKLILEICEKLESSICAQCGAAFKAKPQLVKHVQREHKPEFKCEQCKKACWFHFQG